ncbi:MULTISPECIES: transporter [Pseudomonas]|uniref:transporter n=1 Tax=Pseudomonas TaxID=286 RepID=UPI00093FDFE6|nr:MULTISPECIES: transporter [Pseudomonas]MDH0639588.1 transporter [Pseudomonas sp. GD03860]
MFFSNIRPGVCGLVCLLSAGLAVQAQAIEVVTDPGDYLPAPPGTNLAVLYLQNNQYDTYHANGKEQPTKLGLETNLGLLRFVRYMEVGGFIIDPQIAIPYGEIRMNKNFTGLTASSNTGMGDPLIGGATWLYNDPAKDRHVALLTMVSVPFGDYDGDLGPLNIGQNRWRGIVQLGYATQLIPRSLFEIIGEYAVHGSNDDYFGMKQTREDSYGIQSHLSYSLLPSTRVSVSYYLSFAGETKLDGVAQKDEANDNRWLLSATTSFTRDTQVIVQYGEAIRVRNGPFENQRLNLRLVKMF